MKRLLAFLPSVLLALTPPGAHAAAAPIYLKAYRSLVNLASPRFSPDGARVAFVAIRPDFVHDRYDRTLMVVDTAGGASASRTDGRQASNRFIVKPPTVAVHQRRGDCASRGRCGPDAPAQMWSICKERTHA